MSASETPARSRPETTQTGIETAAGEGADIRGSGNRLPGSKHVPELLVAVELELVAQDVMPESRVADLVVAVRCLGTQDATVGEHLAVAEVITGATPRPASLFPAIDLAEPTKVAPARLSHLGVGSDGGLGEEDVRQPTRRVRDERPEDVREVLRAIRCPQVQRSIGDVLVDVVTNLVDEVGLSVGERLTAAEERELGQPDRHCGGLEERLGMKLVAAEDELELVRPDEQSALTASTLDERPASDRAPLDRSTRTTACGRESLRSCAS